MKQLPFLNRHLARQHRRSFGDAKTGVCLQSSWSVGTSARRKILAPATGFAESKDDEYCETGEVDGDEALRE
ncbi:hypothetical protein LTR39_003803, partial [Cryomyces antarcticus]